MSCEGRPGTTFATLGEIRAPGQWKRVGRRCSPSGVLKLVVNPSYRKIMSLEAGRGAPRANSSQIVKFLTLIGVSEDNIRRSPRCSSSGVLKLVVSPSYRSTSWLEAGRGAPRANSSPDREIPYLDRGVPRTSGRSARYLRAGSTADCMENPAIRPPIRARRWWPSADAHRQWRHRKKIRHAGLPERWGAPPIRGAGLVRRQ